MNLLCYQKMDAIIDNKNALEWVDTEDIEALSPMTAIQWRRGDDPMSEENCIFFEVLTQRHHGQLCYPLFYKNMDEDTFSRLDVPTFACLGPEETSHVEETGGSTLNASCLEDLFPGFAVLEDDSEELEEMPFVGQSMKQKYFLCYRKDANTVDNTAPLVRVNAEDVRVMFPLPEYQWRDASQKTLKGDFVFFNVVTPHDDDGLCFPIFVSDFTEDSLA